MVHVTIFLVIPLVFASRSCSHCACASTTRLHGRNGSE
jgi:hypothetical protein